MAQKRGVEGADGGRSRVGTEKKLWVKSEPLSHARRGLLSHKSSVTQSLLQSTMAPKPDQHQPATLPVLFLSAPNVLLPSLQITIPIANNAVRPLMKLAQDADGPEVGVFPVNDASDKPALVHTWGCGQ